jgi:hypothetical protein
MIQSEDMNLERLVAKCRDCHAIMSFARAVDRAEGAGDVTSRRQRPPVPLPAGLRAEDRGKGLRIVRRWFSPVFFFLLFFCIAWDSFLVFWYAISFGNFGEAPGPVWWLMVIFPVAHLAVGVGLTYFTLAGFLNQTTIDVDPFRLRIRHGPLPWFGNCTLPAAEIDQLYCQEKTRRHDNGGCITAYGVNAVTKGGRQVKLMSTLEDQDQALFIEQQIEQCLGIEDRPVGGELAR